MAKKQLRSKPIGLPCKKRRVLKIRPKISRTNLFLRLIFSFFPHISRNINAGIIRRSRVNRNCRTLPIKLPAGRQDRDSAHSDNTGIKTLIAISLIMLLLTAFFLPVKNPLSPLLSKSDDLKTHLWLIKTLLTNHQYPEAEKEALCALWLFPKDQQLKQISTEIKSLISKQPELIKELNHWEKIMKDRPNYRDGWYQLAVLNYQIMENQKAKEYLEKTLSLDPNFLQARQLLKKIN